MVFRSLTEDRCQVSTKDLEFRGEASRGTLLDGKGCKWPSLWVDELCTLFRRVESSNLIHEPHLLDDCPCAALDINVLPMGEERVALLDDGDARAGLCQEPRQSGPSDARSTDQSAHGKLQSGRECEDGCSELEASTENRKENGIENRIRERVRERKIEDSRIFRTILVQGNSELQFNI